MRKQKPIEFQQLLAAGLVLWTVAAAGRLYAEKDSAEEAEQDVVYDDHGKRDPFWRLVSPSGAILTLDNDLMITDMVLEGIIQDPNGRNLAIINSLVVGPNDKIGLFIVQEVGQDRVVLVKGQESFVLKLKKEE